MDEPAAQGAPGAQPTTTETLKAAAAAMIPKRVRASHAALLMAVRAESAAASLQCKILRYHNMIFYSVIKKPML